MVWTGAQLTVLRIEGRLAADPRAHDVHCGLPLRCCCPFAVAVPVGPLRLGRRRRRRGGCGRIIRSGAWTRLAGVVPALLAPHLVRPTRRSRASAAMIAGRSANPRSILALSEKLRGEAVGREAPHGAPERRCTATCRAFCCFCSPGGTPTRTHTRTHARTHAKRPRQPSIFGV